MIACACTARVRSISRIERAGHLLRASGEAALSDVVMAAFSRVSELADGPMSTRPGAGASAAAVPARGGVAAMPTLQGTPASRRGSSGAGRGDDEDDVPGWEDESPVPARGAGGAGTTTAGAAVPASPRPGAGSSVAGRMVGLAPYGTGACARAPRPALPLVTVFSGLCGVNTHTHMRARVCKFLILRMPLSRLCPCTTSATHTCARMTEVLTRITAWLCDLTDPAASDAETRILGCALARRPIVTRCCPLQRA